MPVTTLPPRVSAGPPLPSSPQRASSEGNRFARWRSNWRIGLTMGLRDARRYRGRSVLITLMIGLPVMLLVAALTYVATDSVSPQEAIPATLGTTQAKIVDQSPQAVIQDAPAQNVWSLDQAPPAKTVPGHRVGDPWTPAQLTALIENLGPGGTILPVGYANLPIKTGDQWRDGSAMVMAGPDLVRSGLGSLVSGRFPAADGELAITTEGRLRGLPSSGEVVLRLADGSNAAFQVVGIVSAVGRAFSPLDLLTTDARLNTFQDGFLIDRPSPMSWAQVQELNAYGLGVVSRSVLTSPPRAADLDPAVRNAPRGGLDAGTLTLIAVGLIAETTLLAGPAFAVSAARRRRSLALAASNGAERHQIRHYVLAQALVLGGTAAVVGAVVGLIAVLVFLAVQRANSGQPVSPPLDVPWVATVGIVALSLLASVVAALLPARGTGRLDMAAVLTGHGAAGPVRRSYPVAGFALMLGVGTAMIALVYRFRAMSWIGYPLAAGALLVLVGAILTLPTVLSILAGLLGGRSLPIRLAVRDGVRQRSRAVPAIAAIVMACAAITALGVIDRSTELRSMQTYAPSAVFGRGVISHRSSAADGRDTVAEVRRQHPDWTVLSRDIVGSQMRYEGTRGRQNSVMAVPAGCSQAEAFDNTTDERDWVRCHILGNDAADGEIVAADEAVADPAVVLTADQRRVLRAGGILVASATLIDHDRLTLATAHFPAERPDEVTLDRTLELPAGLISRDQLDHAFHGEKFGGWMLPSTVVQSKLPSIADQSEVIAPSGPISYADEAAIDARSDPQSGVYVERGYQRPSSTTMLIMFGVTGLLVLVAALIATALGQAESRPDLATLAALGSTVSLRRRLAAAQAVLVALTGAVVGIAVGLPAGIGQAIVRTGVEDVGNGRQLVAPTLALPWTGFVILLVAVPLVAVAVATLGVRRVPSMTRRID